MRIFDKKKKADDVPYSFVKKRLLLVSILIAIIFVLLELRLGYLAIKKGDEYNRIVLSQRQTSYNSEIIQSRRGDILDADGNLLATSIKVYNLIIDPKVILSYKDNRFVNATIDALSFVYDYNKWELRDLIEEKKDASYIRYARQLSKEEKEKFESYRKTKNEEYRKLGVNDRINGVWFEDEYKRYYPNDNLASNVIGFINASGNAVMGLEAYYDTELSGLNGRRYGYLGEDFELEDVEREAIDGYNIVTTIDKRMQRICEEKLSEWQNGEIGSKSASAIVMNPNNGEIYAMASTNGFNLNDPRDVSDLDEEYVEETGIENIWYSRWKNLCVQDTFEPGSTAKVVTFASTVDENLVSNDATFYCNGFIEFDDGEHKWRIRCNNRNGHGELTLMETLTNSCNMSMAEMADMLGISGFTKYQKAFGFGEYTNIDLPNEADTSKLIYNKDTMGRTDLATNAFGQNFNCTMVQLIAAFSSAINGGKYYEPHLVKRIENGSGTYIRQINKPVLRQTISEKTSKYVREALFETVETGTGKLAQIKGRNIGGKTGTAEKLPRSDKNYLVSFIGFDDRDNPNLVLYVVVDEPNLEGEAQASASFATKIFHDIMKDILSEDE
ncbi:MAG: penicillin-binding protein 2 [Lachnospiraceae bacterium]|nr:penicillin-binding protein 2 [Lachnospiraceae bacterium]